MAFLLHCSQFLDPRLFSFLPDHRRPLAAGFLFSPVLHARAPHLPHPTLLRGSDHVIASPSLHGSYTHFLHIDQKERQKSLPPAKPPVAPFIPKLPQPAVAIPAGTVPSSTPPVSAPGVSPALSGSLTETPSISPQKTGSSGSLVLNFQHFVGGSPLPPQEDSLVQRGYRE